MYDFLSGSSFSYFWGRFCFLPRWFDYGCNHLKPVCYLGWWSGLSLFRVNLFSPCCCFWSLQCLRIRTSLMCCRMYFFVPVHFGLPKRERAQILLWINLFQGSEQNCKFEFMFTLLHSMIFFPLFFCEIILGTEVDKTAR